MRNKIKDCIIFVFTSAFLWLVVCVIMFSFIAFRIIRREDKLIQNVYFESAEEQIKSEMMIQGGLLSR